MSSRAILPTALYVQVQALQAQQRPAPAQQPSERVAQRGQAAWQPVCSTRLSTTVIMCLSHVMQAVVPHAADWYIPAAVAHL